MTRGFDLTFEKEITHRHQQCRLHGDVTAISRCIIVHIFKRKIVKITLPGCKIPGLTQFFSGSFINPKKMSSTSMDLSHQSFASHFLCSSYINKWYAVCALRMGSLLYFSVYCLVFTPPQLKDEFRNSDNLSLGMKHRIMYRRQTPLDLVLFHHLSSHVSNFIEIVPWNSLSHSKNVYNIQLI